MKKFLISSALIALMTMIISPLFVYLNYRTSQRSVWKLFMLLPDQNVVVTGDSHAECSFVETNGIKMLTYHSTPLNVSLMRLHELKKRSNFSSVKIIVVNLCYTSISEYSIVNQIESIWRFIPASLSYDSLIPVNMLPLLLYTTKHSNQTPPIATDPNTRANEQSIDDRGNEWTLGTIEKAIKRHFEWTEHPEVMVDDFENELKRSIKQLNDFCSENQIQLIMYSSPLSQGYIDRVPKQGRDFLNNLVSFLSKEKIPYFDYMKSCPSSMFRDGDHLSKRGAEYFTIKFYNDVLRDKLHH